MKPSNKRDANNLSENVELATSLKLRPADQAVEKFVQSLAAASRNDGLLGVAVSGGPDSLALLLLAAAARPGKVKAASVDHGLRESSRKEAEDVAALCRDLDVPHEILTIEWAEKPESAIQERARLRRYRALSEWAGREGVAVLATAHHAEDQAETLLMRLARGSGVRGLAGMRPFNKVPNGDVALVRPLLSWKREELRDICAAAGVTPSQDPSNNDPKFERVRVREAMEGLPWLDSSGLARSAQFLGRADAALDWAALQEWPRRVTEQDSVITLEPVDLPDEICRRMVHRIIFRLKTEGPDFDLRGAELDTLMSTLKKGRKGTLRGVLCGGGPVWRFARAPARRTKSD